MGKSNNDSSVNEKVSENSGKQPAIVKLDAPVKETPKKRANLFDGSTPGPGRPKGVPNKVTSIAKNVIAEAADKLGGVNRLVEWAQEDARNERAFWTALYPKLIPVQVEGPGDNGEHLIQTITRRIIDPKSDGQS